MRRGKAEWLIFDDVMTGIMISADWCSEHEGGVSKIQQSFGIIDDPTVMGVERRRIRKVPERLVLYDITEQWHKRNKTKGKTKESVQSLVLWKYFIPSEVRSLEALSLYRDETVCGAWDSESFGIQAKGSDVQNLEKICEAIDSNDLAIFTAGSSNPFGGGGLVFAIISAMTSEHCEIMESADREHARLQKASDDTGILERLQKAGRHYYACSPRFRGENDRESAYPVIYWLNPRDQLKHQYGWYTVEELDEWVAGTGPVLEMK